MDLFEQIFLNDVVNDEDFFLQNQQRDHNHTQEESSMLDFLDHPFESLDSPVYSTQVFPDEEKPEVTEPTEEPMKKDGKKSKKIKKDLKSTNLPKFILKAFRGQIGWKKKIYKGHENQFLRTKKMLDKMLKEKREEYININLTNLRQIFGGGSQQEREKGKVRKLLNRKAMRQIIGESTLFILKNSRISTENKPLYYKALKTYGYRLMCESLSQRIQLH